MEKTTTQINNIVDELIENFNFERVHSVMEFVGWKWISGKNEYAVPTVEQLISTAKKLIIESINSGYENATGGFYVTVSKYYDNNINADVEYYKLSFELTSIDYEYVNDVNKDVNDVNEYVNDVNEYVNDVNKDVNDVNNTANTTYNATYDFDKVEYIDRTNKIKEITYDDNGLKIIFE